MVSKTPSKLLNIWLSQNRSTLYPSARSHSSRILSPGSSACCPPSSSMTTFFSRITKSTTYLPTGCSRRNLKPSICLFLRCLHKWRSVSVECFLSLLAMPVSPFTPTLFPPPSRGRVSLVFPYSSEWFFITFLTLPPGGVIFSTPQGKSPPASRLCRNERIEASFPRKRESSRGGS